MSVFQLTDTIRFPPPQLAEPNGLLAIGGDLQPTRLVEAYRQGIFPWFSDGDPLLWWHPSPRLVLFPEELKIAKRFARELRKSPFTIRFDGDFEQVIEECAHSRTSKGEATWITLEMREAYIKLHKLGYCHSVECWQDGRLAGGLYGIALDRVFFGESMFTKVTNASKFALVALVEKLLKKGFRLIDCQMTTPHLVSLGAREISGAVFQDLLKRYIRTVQPGGIWNQNEK
jgi:leucyl/phenylalanyl-tRNA--protein transferase